MKKTRNHLIACLICFALFSCHDRSETKDPGHGGEHHPRMERKHPPSPSPVFHKTHEPKKEGAPFSDVVQVGNLYFLSGQIGMDHSTRELVPGGIEAETTQVLENIKAVLEQHEMSMGDVVKALVVLDDIEDFAAFNAIYTTYLPQKPARTTFAAEALAAGAKIEIEVVAVKTRDPLRENE